MVAPLAVVEGVCAQGRRNKTAARRHTMATMSREQWELLG